MKKYILLLAIIPTLSLASVTSDLRFGMKGEQVKQLQSFLVEKGYIASDSKTGYFGVKTLAGVKKYQKDNKLPSTGFVGRLTRLSINTVATTTTIVEVAKEPVVLVEPIAPVILQPIAQATPKIYTILIMEEQTPTYTLGTPVRVYKTSPDVGDYSYVELPVSFNSDIVRVGNKVVIEGTITNGTSTQSAGNEFTFAQSSKPNQIMNLGDVHGSFAFTFTLTDSKGTVIYTKDDSVVIE